MPDIQVSEKRQGLHLACFRSTAVESKENSPARTPKIPGKCESRASNGIHKLNQITRTVHEQARSYRGFNFFDQDDEALFLALVRGEFTISGVQNKALRALFPQFSSGQMSRIIRRLRTHGLIKKASHCYKYYLTTLGKQIVALGLKLKELVIIPELAAGLSR
jgi:hypothetical protein